MNTRSFLKSAILSLVGLPIIGRTKTITFVEKCPLPKIDDDYSYKFTVTKGSYDFKFEFRVTTDILIPIGENQFHLNVYKELCQVIGRYETTNTVPIFFGRLESKQIEVKKFNELVWLEEVNRLVDLVLNR